VRRVARKQGWRLSKNKKGFLVQGSDQVGACHRQLQKLADKKINVTAVDAVTAGKGRWGMILWVKPKDYARAARALRAK
jgi:predicted amino acid-binding ACT domain protein